MYNLYGEDKSEDSVYFKYFKRFVDSESLNSGIFYPSVVPTSFFSGETRTSLCFEIPRKIDIDVKTNVPGKSSNNETFLGLHASDFQTEIKYNEQKNSNLEPKSCSFENNVKFNNVRL